MPGRDMRDVNRAEAKATVADNAAKGLQSAGFLAQKNQPSQVRTRAQVKQEQVPKSPEPTSSVKGGAFGKGCG